MDIYAWAEEIDADYYDDDTGYVYRIKAYNHAIRNGLPTHGIEVYGPHDEFIGIAARREHS